MKPTETYRDRDKTLNYLGFSTYSDYLTSPLWKLISEKVMARDSWKCTICKDRKLRLEAHHVSYTLPVLLGIEPGAIVTVCWVCHEALEFGPKGKHSLQEAQRVTVASYRKGAKRTKFKSVQDFLRYRHKTRQAHVARFILQGMIHRGLDVWYDRILEEIRKRRIPKSYIEYLRLKV